MENLKNDTNEEQDFDGETQDFKKKSEKMMTSETAKAKRKTLKRGDAMAEITAEKMKAAKQKNDDDLSFSSIDSDNE